MTEQFNMWNYTTALIKGIFSNDIVYIPLFYIVIFVGLW